MPVRVLLVDDDPAFLEAMADVLGDDPELVVLGTASTAREALQLVAQIRPDVVVLDVRMAEGGPQLAMRLRERAPWMRVLAMSAHDDEHTVVSMLAAGANGFIAKGALDEDLALCVRRCAAGVFFVIAGCADRVRVRLATTAAEHRVPTPHRRDPAARMPPMH